jgi:hypothetical protein
MIRGPVPEPEPVPEPDAEPAAVPDPEPEPEPEPDAEPEPEPDADPDADPDAEPDADPEPRAFDPTPCPKAITGTIAHATTNATSARRLIRARRQFAHLPFASCVS